MAARNIAANMDKHLALRTAMHRIELQRFEQCYPSRMKPPKAPGSVAVRARSQKPRTLMRKWIKPHAAASSKFIVKHRH